MRNGTLDYLKLWLALMVVGIHVNLGAEFSPQVAHFLVDYLFRVAVPIFFMINGYFAIRIIGDARAFLRWGAHIWVIFSLWTLIYGADALRGYGTLNGVMNATFVGYFHLWYLPAVLTAGGVFHLMRRAPTPWLIAMIGVCYACGLFLQYAGNYHLFRGMQLDDLLQHYPVYRNFLFLGVPFFGAGLLMARYETPLRLPAATVNTGLAAGVALLVGEYALNQSLGMTEGLDLLLALPVLAPFIFLKALQWQRPADSTEISDMATLIFFAHPLILRLLETYTTLGRSFHLCVVVLVIGLVSPAVARLNGWFRERARFSLL